MATNVATLTAKLTTDNSGLTAGLNRADRQVRGFASRSSSAFTTMGRVGTAAAVGLGAAFVGAAAKGVSAFSDFEKGMNEVFTLLPDISNQAMGEMEAQVKDLSKEMGVVPDEIIPSLYQAISAGVPQDNVFDFMEVATKAAIGGVTDLETAVDGLTSVVNAYGADTIDAAEAAVIMFTAVRLGKTTMGDLSRYLFQVNPVAAALGVNFEDVAAALAAMTAQGTPTRVASTQLRQALVELGKAGSEAFDHFREASGQTFTDFIAAGGTVEEAFQMMKDRADDLGVGVGDLFGSIEAGMGVISLTSESGAAAFANAMGEMQDSAGATETAFGQMDQGISRSWDKIKAAVSVGLVDAGEQLAPLIEEWADWFVEVLPSAIDTFVSAVETAAEWIRNFVSGAQAVAGFFRDVMPGSTEMAVIGIGAVGTALAALYAHPVIAGLGLVAGAIALIGANARRDEARVQGMADAVAGIAELDVDWLEVQIPPGMVDDVEELGITHAEMAKIIAGSDEVWAQFVNRMGESQSSVQGFGGQRVWSPLMRELMMARERFIEARDAADSFVNLDTSLPYVGISGALPDYAEMDDTLNENAESFRRWEEEVTAYQEGVRKHTEDTVSGIISVWQEAPEQIELSIEDMKRILMDTISAAARYEQVMTELGNRGLTALQAQLMRAGPEYTAAFEQLLGDAGTVAWDAFLLNLDLAQQNLSLIERVDTRDIEEMGFWLGEIAGLAGNRGFASTFRPGVGIPVPGGVGTQPGGPRAMGGFVAPNHAYLVGEREPEIFIPNTAGTIVPTSDTSGGLTINMNGNLTTTGNIEDELTLGLLMAGVNEHAQFQGISDIR